MRPFGGALTMPRTQTINEPFDELMAKLRHNEPTLSTEEIAIKMVYDWWAMKPTIYSISPKFSFIRDHLLEPTPKQSLQLAAQEWPDGLSYAVAKMHHNALIMYHAHDLFEGAAKIIDRVERQVAESQIAWAKKRMPHLQNDELMSPREYAENKREIRRQRFAAYGRDTAGQ